MTIRITSRREGFRRCGVAHPKGPVEYPDNKFTDKELKALKAEPMLTVEIRKSGADGGEKAAENKAANEPGSRSTKSGKGNK